MSVTVCGADRYSAPEVLNAVGGIGHGKPSDMWSFGATLHVLLTGRNAFGRRVALTASRSNMSIVVASIAAVRKNVLEGRRLIDIRRALKAQELEVFVPLVDDCLHPQPDLRPTASEALRMLRDLNLTSS
jgi:serine/threonine protein kinase